MPPVDILVIAFSIDGYDGFLHDFSDPQIQRPHRRASRLHRPCEMATIFGGAATEPGMGYEIDRDVLDRLTIRNRTVTNPASFSSSLG